MAMDARKKKILLVEDEVILAMNLQITLEEAGHDVSIVIEGEQAILHVENERPDVILMDISLAGEMDGIETARKIKAMSPAPIIFLTGNSDQKTIDDMKQTKPACILQKPVEDSEVLDCLSLID